MRYVDIHTGRSRKRQIKVPITWEEGEEMLLEAMRCDGQSGGNMTQLSVCARIAHGMFGEQFMAADPTQALCYLIAKICANKGAGLDEPARQDQSDC